LHDEVLTAWREAQSYGTMTEGPFLDPSEMFDDVYAVTPPHLDAQLKLMLALED
jgi:2-oxoisovalerate dehydrogenase E1 component alpha subunit